MICVRERVRGRGGRPPIPSLYAYLRCFITLSQRSAESNIDIDFKASQETPAVDTHAQQAGKMLKTRVQQQLGHSNSMLKKACYQEDCLCEKSISGGDKTGRGYADTTLNPASLIACLIAFSSSKKTVKATAVSRTHDSPPGL